MDEPSKELVVRAVICVIAVGAASYGAAAPTYHLQIIPSMEGRKFYASGINDFGIVVGNVNFGVGQEMTHHVFSYTFSTGFSAIPYESPDPYPPDLYAVDINNSGVVAGWNHLESRDKVFTWSSQTGMRWLPGLGSPMYRSRAINSSGFVLGFGLLPEGWYMENVLWDPSGNPQEIPGVAARDLNDAGRIIVSGGWFKDPSGNWTRVSGADPEVASVNNLGQMVGRTGDVAALWNATGTSYMTLGGAGSGLGAIINDRGEVAFKTWNGAGDINLTPAIYWSSMTGARLFDDLLDAESLATGYRIKECYDVNNSGQFLARAWRPGMQSWDGDFVLLNPVPEPATLAALALGTLALLRRRRVRTQ